jgi:hypothetical protein
MNPSGLKHVSFNDEVAALKLAGVRAASHLQEITCYRPPSGLDRPEAGQKCPLVNPAPRQINYRDSGQIAPVRISESARGMDLAIHQA